MYIYVPTAAGTKSGGERAGPATSSWMIPQRLEEVSTIDAAGSTRQLTLAGDSDAAELHGLTMLLGVHGTLDGLNQDLADRIAQGDIDLTTPGVKEHLWQTTLAKLAVDQPNYAAYKRELEPK